MADILDYINTIRLNDVAAQNRVMSDRLDLEGRARYLEDQHGARVMNWYEFNRANPPGKERSRLTQMAIGTLAGLAIGGLVLGGAALLGYTAIATLPILAAGGAAGFLYGLVNDDKPAIQSKQMQRYNSYLDQVEQQLDLHKPRSRTRAVHVDSEAIRSRPAEPASTRFQDMVMASRDEDELTPTR